MPKTLCTFEVIGIAKTRDKRRVLAPGVLDAVLVARQERGWTETECRVEIVDPYRDDDCDERLCARCANAYRGPGIYCSQDCAAADA